MKARSLYIFIFVLVLLGVVVFGIVGRMQSHDAQSKFSTIKSLTPEQYNIELKGVNTPDTNFKNFRGKKIFLNYWGTWCPICVEEMPDIQKLYDKKKDGIQFVLIYVKDDRARVEEYLEKNKYTFPVYEAASPIDAAMLATSFPTTFLIDEQGNIKEKIEGARDWSKLEF